MSKRKEIILTEYQRQFAQEHHGLLLKYMATHGLGDEEYGLFAERYLRTVATYTSNQKLQSKYAFSTILWYRLWAELGRERRRKWHREQREVCLEDVSLQPGIEDDTEVSLIWDTWERILTREQIRILRLKALGYTNRELSALTSVPSREIEVTLNEIRDLLKNRGAL